MDWLNLRVSILRSPEYIGCEPSERAAWLNVLAYSVEQENSGRIKGAALWKDRQWQQTCGVMLSEVQGSAPLLRFDGEDLIVWAFPVEKEAEVKAKREAGAKGGSARSEKKAEAAKSNGKNGGRPTITQAITQAKTEAEPKHNPSKNPTEGEGNRKENSKGKENGSNGASHLSSAEAFSVAWNSLGSPFPKIRSMTKDRIRELGCRMKEPFFSENWNEGLSKIKTSTFCRGVNERDWIADADFFLRPGSLAKVMEGKYDDKTKPEPAQRQIVW